jgi:hypothetical protein
MKGVSKDCPQEENNLSDTNIYAWHEAERDMGKMNALLLGATLQSHVNKKRFPCE